MKKLVFFLCVSFLSFIAYGVSDEKIENIEENCDFLQKDIRNTAKDSLVEWRFNYYYPYNLCTENKPIHKEAIKYIAEIRDTKDKTVQELITDIGNVFCRDYFGVCADKEKRKDTFFYRFTQACNDAKDKSIDQADQKKIEEINIHFLQFAEIDCRNQIDRYLSAYKQAAMEEVSHNHLERIEESSFEYFKPAYDRMRSLSFVWNTFIKIFGNIARSLEGLTPKVFLKPAHQ